MDLDAHLCDINWTIYSLASSKYKTTFWDQCLLLPCDICIGLVHIGCDPPWLPPSLSLLTWLSQSKSKNGESKRFWLSVCSWFLQINTSLCWIVKYIISYFYIVYLKLVSLAWQRCWEQVQIHVLLIHVHVYEQFPK